MAEPTSQFGRIRLGARGPTSEGVFKVTSNGLQWKKTGGGRHVEIPSNDIDSLRWTKVGRHCQLAVKRLQNPAVAFLGFRDQDLEPISEMCTSYLTKSVTTRPMAPEGRNWGEALLDGTRLDYVSVDERIVFSVNLPDVVQAQLAGNKNDVQLEFQNDDTGGGHNLDSLCDMSIHVPPTHPGYEGQDDVSAAKAFLDTIMAKTDAGAVTSADAIVTFNEVAVSAPRGRFDVEMHASFLKLCGQSQEFRVAYSSISRLFILPKTSQPHTLVAISLDPPIRKGQTYYQHILCQFHTDEELEIEMDMSDELFESKNSQCNGKLQRKIQGPAADVFSRAVRGLAAAKISRTGNFRAADTLSLAIKCSYKADLGHLYPLERAFFYVVKPPLLITHEEIECVEFQRQGKDSLAVAKTFDFMIRTKNDQEYQFRNIQKIEWANLFEWAQAKSLRIDNISEAQEGPGGPAGIALDPDEEGSDEDEDFRMASGDDDDGEPSEDDSEDGSDVASDDLSGGDSDGGGGVSAPKPAKRKPKADKPAKAAVKEPPAKKAKKAKKDKNAPKKAMSAFMMFSNKNRESVKEKNPEATFGEMGKLIGAKWKEMSDSEKEPYNEMAAEDKVRYQEEMKAYSAKKAAAEEDDD
uniref:FACT complex subunit SSRP1 n=1 Tax=Tetraselmis chuii TaxID=63592 RepID=A0A7S1X6A4_9CHLO|mmetsp:Transcript_35701/g.63651  ORF Transcript_35701/g.63651 Transcript_35701/m.63651 type:complete len:635 (+) Transcript_35701:115-2019(+)